MRRLYWPLVGVLLVAYDFYLLRYRLSDVQGNVEAQFIIITPMFLLKHWSDVRRARRDRAEVHARLDAQDEAMAETHRKVGELHALHVGGQAPRSPRRYRPYSGDPPST